MSVVAVMYPTVGLLTCCMPVFSDISHLFASPSFIPNKTSRWTLSLSPTRCRKINWCPNRDNHPQSFVLPIFNLICNHIRPVELERPAHCTQPVWASGDQRPYCYSQLFWSDTMLGVL